MKKLMKWLMLVSVSLGVTSLYALEIRTGSKIIHTYDVDGDYAIFAGDVEVNSDIDGNLYLLGGNVYFNGSTDNDLYIAGGDVVVNGTVEDNVYIAGGNIRLTGRYYNDVNLAGGEIVLDSASYIRGDVAIAGDDITLSGHIQGDVEIHGNKLYLNGNVDGNLETYVEEYQVSEMALVTGVISHQEPREKRYHWKPWGPCDIHVPRIRIHPFFAGFNFFLFSLICAALWYYLFPASFKGSGALIKHEPVKMGLWGLLCLILIPLLGIFSMIFIVSIPFSILFLLFFGVTVFLGQFPLAVWLGDLITKNIPGFQKGMLPAATGLLVLHLLIKIPLLTFLFFVIWVFVGFGSIWYWILKRQKALKITAPAAAETAI